jgi:hypothetical protein
METSAPPRPSSYLTTDLYYQLVYTLTDVLPPPIDRTPDALRTRNLAAIAKIAALLPVNANEVDLAAQCIATRGQAEDLLRLVRQNADDIKLAMRLNAQYASMVRTSLSVQGQLIKVQTLRQKRATLESSANQDAWTLHIAERSMLEVADPDPNAAPRQATRPEAAESHVIPDPSSSVIPRPRPTTSQTEPHTTQPQHHENETESQDVAFETWLSAHLQGQEDGQPSGRPLPKIVPEATTETPPTSPTLPVNGCESPENTPVSAPASAMTRALQQK